jgi:hypothetical protein
MGKAYKRTLIRNKHTKKSMMIDIDEAPPTSSIGSHASWPRGHKSRKQDLKCEASRLHLQETFKGLIVDEEVSNDSREIGNTRRRRNK